MDFARLMLHPSKKAGHLEMKIEEDSWSMSLGFCSWTSPSLSTPNINEASSKDIAASLHKNVLSWGVWRGPDQKESVSPRAITHSAYSHTAERRSYSGVSSLFRTASVPDVVGGSPKTAFSSITIATRKVLPSFSTLREPVYPSAPAQPIKVSTVPKVTFGRGVLSLPVSRMRVSNSQSDMCRQNSTTITPNDFTQAYSPADELALRDRAKRKVQLVRHGLSHTDGNRKQETMYGSLTDPSSQPSYRSCVHLEVPLRSASSVVFLDKSLCISLAELEGRRASQPTLFRSTFSVRLCGSSCSSFSKNNKTAKTNLGYGRPRSAKLGGYKQNIQESNSGPPPKHRGDKVEKIAPALGVNSNAYGSDTQHCGAASGLLSFRRPSHSNTKAGRQKGNADEAAFLVRNNFKQRQYTSNTQPVDSTTCSKQTRSNKTEERHELDSSTELQKVFILEKNLSRPKADSLEETTQTLSLKEALELFRPDFINRSQGRVRRLEQRAVRRRALQESNPDLVQDLREEGCRQWRKCTTPDPLSDNLFKPRERSISGREMQLRSRRIYNKLPEVTKKKEEEKKRAVSQTNRLRAEVFKKRLLDQILQR
ncbi:uncharacterized protein LOC117812047 [Notolabrus celidotus]|uniref:uncharacterized protein LOC117812047 n=1 Tax=Notolabrus celidotus TaxID=1203425 RepID=UPI00148FE2C9|nr:uncharacterized protein LOC117812047 [Notolabrus celidotus]